MIRFIETEFWENGKWTKTLLNTSRVHRVDASGPSSDEGTEAPRVFAAVTDEGGAIRWLRLNLTWAEARGAFAAVTK